MISKSKECKKCGQYYSSEYYLPTSSPFFQDGRCDICIGCLYKKVDPTNFRSVDKLLQYLDLPFYPDIWDETYTDNENKAIEIYCEKMQGNEYRGVDWTSINNMWLDKIKNGTIQTELSILNKDWIDKMKIKWGAGYSFEQLTKLEEILNDTLKKQNIVTDIQLSQARIICMTLLTLEEKARNGINVSKELKEITDTIAKSGFEAKNTKSYGDFESIGELINHCVKKGYKPKFYEGREADIVDSTIKNQQAYLKRLVMGEPGLGDQVEQRQEAIKIAERLEANGYDEEAEIDNYSEQAYNSIEYEGEADFNE